MKRALWNITLASLLTLIAYLALYTIWGAILNALENPALQLFLVAFMTTIAFGAILLCVSKIRKSVGEDEILTDYNGKEYTSFANDFKVLIKREYKTLICIIIIVLLCFVLNLVRRIIPAAKFLSLPTFLFAPMCLFDVPFSGLFNLPFVGYLVSAILDCIAYIIILLIYRKKKYNYWMKPKD